MSGKSRKQKARSGESSKASGGSRESGSSGDVGNAARASELAEDGTQGSGSEFPYLEQIQASFGHHDLSEARAHQGPQAEEAAGDLSAEAYAHGSDAAFGSAPDLHTAAHEAAHLVQQASGAGPASGVGRAGDQHEQLADRVADRVVAGESAEALLDQVATPGRVMGGGQAAVQMRELPEKVVSGTAMTRLGHAEAGIDHTKQVLSHGAGNQLEALQATNFNSYFRLAAMRDPDCWELDPSVYDLARQYPEALTAAKADLAQGGNCGEHAAIAYDFLRRTASSEVVNRCDKQGLDHAFVILGDVEQDADDELVVCDPWPTAPTACLWEDHFAHTSDRGKLNTRNTITGDDEDVKAAIAKGLSLSPKGKRMIQQSLSEEETKQEIDKGTEGDKPWIWQHPDAASRKYDYQTAEPEQEQPSEQEVEETAAPSGEASAATGFLAWIRQMLGL